MKRREFFKGAGLGALALNGGFVSPTARRALMKLGTQQASPTDDMLRYFAQFGVSSDPWGLAHDLWRRYTFAEL